MKHTRGNLRGNRVRAESGGLVLPGGIIVVLENIRQGHRADIETGPQQVSIRHLVKYVRAKATGRALLDGDEHAMMAGELRDQIVIERLCESRIGDGA